MQAIGFEHASANANRLPGQTQVGGFREELASAIGEEKDFRLAVEIAGELCRGNAAAEAASRAIAMDFVLPGVHDAKKTFGVHNFATQREFAAIARCRGLAGSDIHSGK